MRDLVNRAGSLAASHGFAVNLAVVILLAAIGGCLLSGRAALARPAALVAVGVCVTDWVFVQDLGFLGGIGTDPNSMVPQAVLVIAGLVAMTAHPAAVAAVPAASAVPATGVRPEPADTQPGWSVRNLGVALGMAHTSSVLTLWAGAMVLLGSVPMVLATVQR